MKSHSIPKTLSRIRKIVSQETGQDLSRHALREIEAELAATDSHHIGDENSDFQTREVTILLADLRGFTSLSADLPAGQVIEMLNPVLVRMSEVIFKHGGTIDKFMGDSIMVLFGAIRTSDDDVARALACAVEMQVRMQELNIEHRAKKLPELFMGIGINTGEVMAGVLGSAIYSEYTVIGNEVNLASRIEAFSLRGQVLISESTYDRCHDFVEVGTPMAVHVKGKSHTVSVREVLAIPTKGLRVPRQEVRRSHRVNVDLPFSYQIVASGIVLPQVYQGKIHDISYHGVLAELDMLHTQLTELKLLLTLPQVNHTADNLYGRIVNQKRQDGVAFAGIEFTSIPVDTTAKLQLFVQLLVFSE
jgi:adenylate cyclase